MKVARRADAFALTPASPMTKISMRVRRSAFLNGDFGRALEEHTRRSLGDIPGLHVERLPIGLVAEAREAPGVLMEHVLRAAPIAQEAMRRAYPAFLQELGPIWAGTFCVVLDPEVAS